MDEFLLALAMRQPSTVRPRVQVRARAISLQNTRLGKKRPPAAPEPTYAGPGRGPNGESSN